MAELVDAGDSKSPGPCAHESSSLSSGTKNCNQLCGYPVRSSLMLDSRILVFVPLLSPLLGGTQRSPRMGLEKASSGKRRGASCKNGMVLVSGHPLAMAIKRAGQLGEVFVAQACCLMEPGVEKPFGSLPVSTTRPWPSTARGMTPREIQQHLEKLYGVC